MELISVDQQNLKGEGFTDSGATRYINTIKDYSELLFEKSKKLGESRKSKDSALEINYEIVQAASRLISASFGNPDPPKWKLWSQAGEYLLTAACGYLGSEATQDQAPVHFTLLFVVSAILGVGLFIARKTSKD